MKIPTNKTGVLMLGLIALGASAASFNTAGVPNFHQVDDRVFRGGQPSDDAWRSLAKLGVRTVIDLRRENEDNEHSTSAEAQAVRAAGMQYVNIPMKGAPAAPSDDQIATVLSLLDSNGRFFVHCKKGKDRTGTVIACYRIAHQPWSNNKALDEAKEHGIHWYEMGMKSYIVSFSPANVQTAGLSTLTPAGAQP